MQLNHLELQKYLGRCLDPLPGLPDHGQGEPTISFLKNRHLTGQPQFLYLCCGSNSIGNLMTRRAAHLAHHAGQISFPGGKIEPLMQAVEAALREAREEVQLNPGLVQVGVARRVRSPAGFVQPVVGIIRGEVPLVALCLTQRKWI